MTAFKLSITTSITLSLIMLVGVVYNKDFTLPNEYSLIHIFLSNFIVTYLLFLFSFNIIQKKWRKGIKAFTIIVGSFLIMTVLSFLFSESAFKLVLRNDIPISMLVILNLIKDSIVVIIVLLTTLLLHSLNERQMAQLENQRLISENIRIRYEVLKNQVDPHFLFNSLNTLDGLIAMDRDKAHEYVQNLSSVFRYAIGNKEVLHLNEELEFTESYANLMKIRYGDNFQIQYHIDEKYLNWFVMPISLQLLVENATKHNIISTKYPLIMTIETTPNDTIRVINNIRQKTDAEPGEGIGLANLTERYKLLFQKEIVITKTDDFCVEIPLIKELETAKNKKKNKNESCYC